VAEPGIVCTVKGLPDFMIYADFLPYKGGNANGSWLSTGSAALGLIAGAAGLAECSPGCVG
jgi:hypothetical protein